MGFKPRSLSFQSVGSSYSVASFNKEEGGQKGFLKEARLILSLGG